MDFQSYAIKKEADTWAYGQKKKIDFLYAEDIARMHEELREERLKKSVEIFDKDGELFYGFYRDGDNFVKANRVSSCGPLDFSLYYSCYPDERWAILAEANGVSMSCNISGGGKRYFAYDFFRRLSALGYRLSCRKSIWRELADAYMSYLIHTSVPVEIPGCYGWNKMKDGSWKYVKRGELCMEGVVANAE